MNLAHDMERRAKEDPGRIGLFFNDEALTFLDVDRMSARAGNYLKSVGIGKGKRLAIFLPSTPRFIAVLFGAWKIGAAVAPVNNLYKDKELRRGLEQTKADAVITDEDGLERVNALGMELQVLRYDDDLLGRFSPVCPSFVPGEQDVALMPFTGGTSGEARAAILTHVSQYATLSNLASVSKGKPGPFPIARPDTSPNFVAMPLFHMGGLMSLLIAYNVGRSVVMMRKFEPATFVRLVAKHRPDTLALMPTMIQMLLNHPDPVDLSSVKSILSTGQELNPTLKKRFELRFNVPIIQNYGSTEAGHVAGWTIRDIKDGRWKPGAVGRVYENVQVSIRDPEGRELPVGETGQIWIKTKGTMTGYAGKDSVKEGVISEDGLVTTSDLGYLDSDNCLFVVGRSRDMIKCGGFQVLPGELEEALREHPAVLDVAVVGVPDDRLGEMPKAFVVLKNDSQDTERLASELIEYCRSKVAHYKAVRAVGFVHELPKSEVGKVVKRVLQDQN